MFEYPILNSVLSYNFNHRSTEINFQTKSVDLDQTTPSGVFLTGIYTFAFQCDSYKAG